MNSNKKVINYLGTCAYSRRGTPMTERNLNDEIRLSFIVLLGIEKLVVFFLFRMRESCFSARIRRCCCCSSLRNSTSILAVSSGNDKSNDKSDD